MDNLIERCAAGDDCYVCRPPIAGSVGSAYRPHTMTPGCWCSVAGSQCIAQWFADNLDLMVAQA